MKKTFNKIFDCIMGANVVDGLCGLSLVSLLLLLILAASSHAATDVPQSATIDRYVIAISANNGGKGRPTLRYAESDAKSFAGVLKDMGGVEQKNVFLIREPSVSFLNARLNDLDKTLAASKGKSGREEVLVYYSGHADEKGLHLGEETYSWQEFRKRVDALNADVKIAVIDACGSGAITRAKGGVAVPAFMVDQSSDMKGYAFITSSTQDESSQESDKLRGSFFTHSLVSGLRGAGDLSGDGKVTLSEAYQFAFNETLQKTETTMGGAQHPSRDMNLTGTGDVVMTDLRSTSAGMTLDDNIEGRVFIRDASGELVAELYKKSGRPMSLGLPAGRYTVRLEQPAELKETSVSLVDGKQMNVTAANFAKVSTEKTTARGGIEIGGDNNDRMDSLDRNSRYRTTFNAVDTDHNPRKGLMLGVFLTKSDDIMLGSQASFIGNVAREDMHGFQASGVFNVARRNFEGLQLAGTFNGAGRLEGIQIAPINAVKDASPNAVQIGPINLAKDTIGRAQVGAINVVGQTKVQAGAINIGKNAHVQGGAINVALNVDDTQVGAINVASHAKGRQWGIINIAGNAEKTPIGLLNFVGNGVWNITGSVNELGAAAMSVHFGTAYYFTALEFSREFEKGTNFRHFDDVYENGIGIGTQFGKYGSHLELEYMFLNVNTKYSGRFDVPEELFKKKDKDEDDKDEKGSKCESGFHHRLRLGYTAQVIRGIGLSVGGTLNLSSEGYAEKDLLEPLGEWHDSVHSSGHDGRIWPGFYAGLTFGRF